MLGCGRNSKHFISYSFFSPPKDVARNEEEYFYVFYLLFSHNKSISNNDI